MVQAHPATRAFERPDGMRIAALSGAMALNFAGLMLLLIPISMPTAPAVVEDDPDPMLIFPEIEEIKPLPPMPIAPILPPKPKPRPVVQPQPQPDLRPVFDDVVIADPVPPSVPTVEGPVEPEYTGPAEVGELATLVATPPRYPPRVLRAGIEGTVLLRILVGTDGLPLEVIVDRSSGNRELDFEARRHVQKKWKFQPAMRNGRAVQAWGTVSIVFSMARA